MVYHSQSFSKQKHSLLIPLFAFCAVLFYCLVCLYRVQATEASYSTSSLYLSPSFGVHRYLERKEGSRYVSCLALQVTYRILRVMFSSFIANKESLAIISAMLYYTCLWIHIILKQAHLQGY